MLYVLVVGLVVLCIELYFGSGGWPLAVAFVVAAAMIAGVTWFLLAPRVRRLREATELARALSELRFDGRMEGGEGEFSELAAALNAAAGRIGSLVAQLRLERAQLEALLNASSDATVAVDAGGGVVYLNDAARALFSRTGTTEPGRQFIEVVRDHDLNAVVVAAAERGERSVRVVPYGPAQRWLQATAVPIAGAGTWAALAIFHDLTEVRRLDSMRRDFISNVSHELRTPLAGIRASAETLQEGALEDPRASMEFLGHIQRETDRMTQMVEELLELSRIESGAAPMTFAQLDAAALAEGAVRRFARQAERAGVTLDADLPEGEVVIIGDGERLERALGNLVANALKFTPAGGSVTVLVRDERSAVIIGVRDTGVGIEPEEAGRVFERFYKADRGRGGGGIGLGLAIVKHIVRAHDGDVSVESRPGRGSLFTMRLPRR